MNKVFFSVVVPCYNVEITIIPTLESLKNQEFTDFEIIFVNDGSIDNTQDILDSFDSPVKKKIINQKNSGLGSARNTGIKACSGEYVALLDADDLWAVDKLKIAYQYLNEGKIECLCHNEYVVNAKNKLIKKNVYGPYTKFDDLYFRGNCLSPSAVIVKKDVFNKVGLFIEDLNLHGVEDYEMWMRMALCEIKIFYINNFLGSYVIHGNNMSSSEKFSIKEERLLVIYANKIRKNSRNTFKIKKRFLLFYLINLKNSLINWSYLLKFMKNIILLLLPGKTHLAVLDKRHNLK